MASSTSIARRSLALTTIVCIAAVGAVLLAPTPADACSWSPWEMQAAVPAEGAEIPPEAEFSIWFQPDGNRDLEFDLVDDAGNDVEIQVDRHSYGAGMGAVAHYRIVPDELLATGVHQLTISAPDGDSFSNTAGHATQSKTMEFEVVDGPVSAPSVDQIQWTRSDSPPRQHTDCYEGSRQWNEVEIQTDPDLEDVWHEIRYDTEAGDQIIATQPAGQPLRHHLTEAADCVTVESVALDGSRSAPVERCEPDVCQEGEETVDCTFAGCSTTGTTGPTLPAAILILVVLAATGRARVAGRES